MATVTATHTATLSSDALFRAWSQFIHDAIVTTAGWTDTAATGEVNLTTMTAPGANNTYAGFKVYRMADSLQATYPCYLKIEYGRGNGTNLVSLRLGVGTAHDGSGNLTGTQALTAQVVGSNTTTAGAVNCFASGDTGRIAVAMFADNTNGQQTFAFGVERTKDASGADDGTGLVFVRIGYETGGVRGQSTVIPPSGGVAPTEQRLMMPFPKPSASAIYNSKAAVGLLIPFAGEALRPVTNWGYVNLNDAGAYASTVTPTAYGATRTYLHLGSATAWRIFEPTGSSLNNIAQLFLRYD